MLTLLDREEWILIIRGNPMSKVYALAKQAQRVGGEGITNPWWLEILAVGKNAHSAEGGPYVPANEYISSALGTFIGLPVPPFAMLEKRTSSGRESLWFASLDYRLAGETMPDIHPPTVYSELPEICLGVALFDLWVVNTDRHAGNLSYDPTTTPKRLNVFDHSHTLFRWEGVERLNKHIDSFTLTESAESQATRHCLIDHIDNCEAFANWFHRIQSTPDFLISDLCGHACELGLIAANERDAAIAFLKARRDNLITIVRNNWQQFPALREQPMGI